MSLFSAACLGYVRCLGRPVYHFEFIRPAQLNPINPLIVEPIEVDHPVRLKVYYNDPYLRRSDLRLVSELGRLSALGMVLDPDEQVADQDASENFDDEEFELFTDDDEELDWE